MENTGKFIDLIQGNLGDESERGFFAELSQNDELRQEYKCFISVTDSINRSIESFSPSTALKNRVFAAAGMAVPSQQVIPADLPENKTSNRGRLTSNIITGTASSVITFLLMLILFGGNSSTSDRSGNRQEAASGTAGSASPAQKAYASVIPKEIIKYVYVSKKKDKSEQVSHLTGNSIEEQGQVSIDKPVLSSQSTGLGHFKAFSPDRSFQSLAFPEGQVLSIPKTGLDVEFKSSTNWNIPRETIDPTIYSKLNNLDLTILYGLGEHFKAGASLKEETFYTVYTGTDSKGSLYRYYQQPNFLTFCLDARYYPFAGLSINPFIQFGLGANAGGWVLRPAMGIEYYTNDDISLILGIDYSYFNFMHQSNRFSTQKIGLNYGISYHF